MGHYIETSNNIFLGEILIKVTFACKKYNSGPFGVTF